MSFRVTRSAASLAANPAAANISPTRPSTSNRPQIGSLVNPSTSNRPQIGYMHLKTIRYHYNLLKPKSPEASVDDVWNNILPMYFEIDKNYSIGVPQRFWLGIPNPKVKADITIRPIQHISENGQPEKVVLFGDKCVTDESSDTAWKTAVEQVTAYMIMTRTSQYETPDEAETMYAIVTVGRYSRFYELQPGETELQDYGNTGGQPYHFKKDENSIDALLLELVHKTSSS